MNNPKTEIEVKAFLASLDHLTLKMVQLCSTQELNRRENHRIDTELSEITATMLSSLNQESPQTELTNNTSEDFNIEQPQSPEEETCITVNLTNGKFRIVRERSTAIRVYNPVGNQVMAKPVLRQVIKEHNLDIDEAVLNTRQTGREVLRKFGAL